MATRSNIGYTLPTGEIRMIYCHYDGYPEHNGRILQEHYSSQERVEELVSFGDMSILAQNPGMPHQPGHSFDSPEKGICVYYGRDRKETGTEPQTAPDSEESRQEEYLYVWDGHAWRVCSWQWDGWKPLAEVLESVSA